MSLRAAALDLGRRASSPPARLRRQLFSVLTWVEQQEGSGIATITSDGTRLGELVVSRGRLCIAIPARLCDAHPGAALDAGLADLVGRARAAGRFSATASQAGPGELAHARAGLLRLLAGDLACLLGAAEGDSLAATMRPAADDYEPQLTFSAGEVCAAALATRVGALEGLAAELVRTLECPTVLVLARAQDPQEFPYPVAARGLDRTSLRELFRIGRAAFDLCGTDTTIDGREVELQVVSVSADDSAWHFVGAARRLVVVRADGETSSRALGHAVSIATAV